jgi:hypothetical protein
VTLKDKPPPTDAELDSIADRAAHGVWLKATPEDVQRLVAEIRRLRSEDWLLRATETDLPPRCRTCYVKLVPARIVVDDAVPEAKRPGIVDTVRAALNGRDEDGLIAVVSRKPDGRLQVFVNHIEDPSFVATVEAAIARL